MLTAKNLSIQIKDSEINVYILLGKQTGLSRYVHDFPFNYEILQTFVNI